MHKLSPTWQKQLSFLFCQMHQIMELSQFVALPSVPQSDKAVWGFLESMVTFQAFSCLELHHACKHECTDNVYISFCHLVTAFQNLPKQTECSLGVRKLSFGQCCSSQLFDPRLYDPRMMLQLNGQMGAWSYRHPAWVQPQQEGVVSLRPHIVSHGR